jgi:hypothetical protein
LYVKECERRIFEHNEISFARMVWLVFVGIAIISCIVGMGIIRHKVKKYAENKALEALRVRKPEDAAV